MLNIGYEVFFLEKKTVYIISNICTRQDLFLFYRENIFFAFLYIRLL